MDHVDRKLLSILELNGRATLKQLGDSVGFSPTGIKKRLNRLVNQDVLKVSALLNLETLNIQAALLLLELESGIALHEYLERFGECPRIVNMFVTLGGFNLALLIIAEDSDTLNGIASGHCPLRAHQGVRRSEFFPVSELLFPYLPVRGHLIHGQNEKTPCNWDCKDCSRYQNKKCVGCPATTNYRGPL